jgi:hypothetical protein
MPYGTIVLLIALIATSWFVVTTEASHRAKLLVFILLLSSLAIGFYLPQWWLIGLLLQAFLVICIVLYSKALP